MPDTILGMNKIKSPTLSVLRERHKNEVWISIKANALLLVARELTEAAPIPRGQGVKPRCSPKYE